MNELDPELKQLLKWVHEASPSASPEATFGFSSRVLASVKPPQDFTLFEGLRRAAWGLICAALLLIVGGGAVLTSQQQSSSVAPEEFTSEFNFLASNLPQ